MKSIQIATRKSPLALAQAEWVKSKLEEAGLQADLIPIETKGDKVLEKTIAKIGSKGVFTEELEEMLKNGDADIAVHSAKDLASELPDGFDIISYGIRAASNDVLISHQDVDLKGELSVGTSSTRRVAQLANHFPNLVPTPIRGNLQTRIEKMKSGECDALVLARAGVERMDLTGLIKHDFSIETLTPAAGQGCIAIEAYESIHPTIRKLIKAATNDGTSNKVILAEREFLRNFGGGCSIPVFAHATMQEDKIRLHAGILSLDGTESIQSTHTGDVPGDVGLTLAKEIKDQGGDEILQIIKSQLD